MNQPRITALLPVKHYHPVYLQQSVASISQQSDDWRLMVITESQDYDHFADILRPLLSGPRARLVVNEGRKLAGAINTGMRHAHTEFVAVLLADDLWATDAVRVLSSYIDAHREVDFFHSSRRIIDMNGKPISAVYKSRPSFTLDDFKTRSPVKHLLCWRTSKALAIGGLDETLNSVGPDDYDFPWTMAEHGARFRAVEECLYFYRDHRDCYRLTTHLPLSTHRRECHRIFKKHGVGWRDRRRYIARAQRSFMRQCLYRNALDKWIKETLGYDAQRGWRQTYR
jgi:glycosyltransferase involved in cell wall biosynthesis